MLRWFVALANWWADRQYASALLKKASAPVARDIDGLGVVHIRPLNVTERMAVATALQEEGEKLTLYLWIITLCVTEFNRYSATKLGKHLPSMPVIKALVEAVLDVSGMTKASQEAMVKK